MEKLASNVAPIYHSHSGLALFRVRGTVRRLGGQKIEVGGGGTKGNEGQHLHGAFRERERETSSGSEETIFSSA